MIKHHPSAAVLRAHVLGELSDGFALAVATHISLCPHCQATYDQFEASTSKQQLEVGEPVGEIPLDINLNDMLQSILNERVHPELRDRRATPRSSSLKVNGESFEVPWPLQRIAGQVRSWTRLGEGLHAASLSLESEAHRISFLYISKGCEVPEYVLGKNEITMVLAGCLSDQCSSYIAGDFVVKQPEDCERPHTSDESCLCLTVLSEPLRLNSTFSIQPTPFFNQLRQGSAS